MICNFCRWTSCNESHTSNLHSVSSNGLRGNLCRMAWWWVRCPWTYFSVRCHHILSTIWNWLPDRCSIKFAYSHRRLDHWYGRPLSLASLIGYHPNYANKWRILRCWTMDVGSNRTVCCLYCRRPGIWWHRGTLTELIECMLAEPNGRLLLMGSCSDRRSSCEEENVFFFSIFQKISASNLHVVSHPIHS